MMALCYLGIDPGLTGALVVLDHEGSVLLAEPMPIMPGGKGKDVLDHAGLHLLFERIRSTYPDLYCVLERQQAFPQSRPCPHCKKPVAMGQGGTSTMTTGVGFGALLQEVACMRHEVISPQTWQKTWQIRGKKNETGKQARVVAQRLFPRKVLVRPGCLVPHPGVVDSVLIAEFARRRHLGVLSVLEVEEEEL